MAKGPSTKTIIEPSQEIKVWRECDVVVVGGGPEVMPQRSPPRVTVPIQYWWRGTGILAVWQPAVL